VTDTGGGAAPSRAWRGPLALAVAVCGVLALRLFQIINAEAVNILYTDQWDFDDPILFHPVSLWAAFTHQHGPHRQGLGALVGLLVGRLSQWNTRAEAFAIGGIVVIAALCALWLKQRLFGSLSYWDAAIPMLFFTRVQWETYLGTTNPAHGSLPLLLVILFALAWTLRRDRVKYPLALAVDFAAIYTGFGVFLGFVAPPLFALDAWRKFKSAPRESPWGALAACAASFGALGSFFVGYTVTPHADCFPSQPVSLTHCGAFLGIMFARFFAARGYYFPMIAGAAAVIVLAAVLLLRLRALATLREKRWNAGIVAVALIAFSLAFGFNAALGRACLGVTLNTAGASRYMIYLVPAYLALYFHLASHGSRFRLPALCFFLALALYASFPSGVAHKGRIGEARRNWKSCYVKSGDIAQCDAIAHTSIYPAPDATHLQQKLDFLKVRGLNLFAK
jgi:hypothetical protein